MRNSCLGWAFAGLIWMGALGCSRALPDWNGTWKLNESKSSIAGPSFSMTISPTGEYHYNNGAYSFSFRCDGKEYSMLNRTISCLQTSASALDTTSKENGAKVTTAHWELSADGKMLTIGGTSIQSDGAVKSKEIIYSRTSASTGLAGDWTDLKRLKSIPALSLALNERSLHIAFSDGGQYMDAPLDGSDAPMRGPGVRQGLTMAISPRGPREFLTLRKFGGQIVNQGTLRLSADGAYLVEEYWPPSKPDQKAVLVYERQ